MPTYDYRCEKCGKVREIRHSINERHLASCLFCSGKMIPKISARPVHFKGSGFYETDYKNK